MSIPEPLIPNTTIAAVAFVALQRTLQQSTQFIREQDPEAVVYIVQESSLKFCPTRLVDRKHVPVDRFTLVISSTFSGLLLANVHAGFDTPTLPKHCHGIWLSADGHSMDTQKVESYDVELVFEPGAIAHFLEQLLEIIPQQDSLKATLTHALSLIQPNHSGMQSQFTICLMAELVYTLDFKPQEMKSLLSCLPKKHLPGNSAPSYPASVGTLSEEKQILHQIAHQSQSEDRTKSEFLATMSHELRTPLTYILGMSATLLRWSAPGSVDTMPDRQRRYLQNIHDQGEHLLELINDLLDLSQLESGRLGLEFQEFSLQLLMQQTLNIYRKKALSKKVSLELDSHMTLESDRITADPHRLQQIVSNLLSNAIKFTPDSGKVIVRVSADDHLIQIQVCDTGIGIPEHHRSVIFQKFKQLDSSYHREYEGTGLGLALTKQLVDLHGGWVECDSTVGIGTVFTVKLPRQPFSPTTAHRLTRRPIAVSPPLGRLALLDDSDESGHLISDMLTAAGYQVVWMLEGLTAISQLEMLQPTLVIINAQLVHRQGGKMNLIQVLRQNPMTKRAKIIVLSDRICANTWGIDPTGEADAVLELSSPFHPEELLHLVAVLMATIHAGAEDVS